MSHLQACHVCQFVLRALVEVRVPQSLGVSGRLIGGCGVWTELRRKEGYRPWLGGWKKSDFPAVGNITSKGTERGNCKTCPASPWVRSERRLHELMQWDLGQAYGLEVDLGGPCSLSKECVWGPIEVFWEERWEHGRWAFLSSTNEMETGEEVLNNSV